MASHPSPPANHPTGFDNTRIDRRNSENEARGAPYHNDEPVRHHHHQELPPQSSGPSYSTQADANQALNTANNVASIDQAYTMPEHGSEAPLYATSAPPNSHLPTIDDRLRQPTSPERLAQGVLSMGDQPEMGTTASLSLDRRKRNKVSRACDLCRARKIKCDAPPEPTQACTTCKKSGIACQFNRAPLKRGPSKGYITQLTDRVSSLEHQLGPGVPMNGPDIAGPHYPQNDRQEYLSPAASDSSRKRKRSTDANVPSADQPLNTIHQAPYGLMPSDSQHNVSSSGLGFDAVRSAQNAATTSANNVHYRYEARDSEASHNSGVRHASEPLNVDLESAGWSEEVVDEYYRLIHPTFPLLPSSRPHLRRRLALCPHTLRLAFLGALECLISGYPSSRIPPLPDAIYCIRRTTELISQYQWEHTRMQPLSISLTYIQALILMTLESDNRGPGQLQGQQGPPTVEWLGRAIGIATHLRLNILVCGDGNEVANTDEELGKRVWWILFIMDKWHASSSLSLPLLPEDSASLLRQDSVILGERTYHLARLSYILGHLSMIQQQPASLLSPETAAGSIIGRTVLGELDRFRESVDSLLQGMPNLIHLSYWHVRLTALSLTTFNNPHDLLLPATRIASISNQSHDIVTPLNHHFAALSALMLVKLRNIQEMRAEAERGIDNLLEALEKQRWLVLPRHKPGWGSAIRDLLARNRSSQSVGRPGSDSAAAVSPQSGPAEIAGLQHLADAAIRGNGRGGQPAEVAAGHGPTAALNASVAAFNPSTITRYGYLGALAREGEAESYEYRDLCR